MPKILAIDDKMDNLVTLSALLANLMRDCAVITAQSGREGIAKAKVELPDAILLDVKMPDMDGFETCRRLKNDAGTKHIPVIMITAIKTDSQSRIKGLEIGADAFLAKPIDEYELVSQVKVALRIKKAEEALREERDSLERVVEERTALLRNEISERKRAEETLEEERRRLQQALDEVRTLRGIVPICAYCKKIRDDEGYWNQVEKYVSDHTDAQFSHGICPACFEREMEEIKA